jgi:hypothetical protein
MKIAILGTAPSSVRLAPFGDPSWKIWGCSPGLYPICPRSDAWFEIHRQEAPVIGQADKQVPWLSPEYWMWLAKHPRVYMVQPHPQIPNSVALPFDALLDKYGYYFFTSSIAWMMAMAIEEILSERNRMDLEGSKHADGHRDTIGLWGVDMAATEEYGYQRAGCQFFVQLAADLDIDIMLPPESDLMTPPALYGVFESTHMAIKLTTRMRELQSTLAQAENALNHAMAMKHRTEGAIDDLRYIQNNWMNANVMTKGVEFKKIFAQPSKPEAKPEVVRKNQ